MRLHNWKQQKKVFDLVLKIKFLEKEKEMNHQRIYNHELRVTNFDLSLVTL